MKRQRRTPIIIASVVIIMASMGVRQSFGIFLQPISESLGVGRGVFRLAMAVQNIMFGLPLVAILADRFWPRWIVAAGGLLYAVGLLMIRSVTVPFGLYATLGIFVGLALSGTTYTVVLGGVAQLVAAEKRSATFGIITAAGSFGMFVIVPGAQVLLSRFGWQQSFTLLAALGGIIVILAFAFPARPGRPSDEAEGRTLEEHSFVKMLNRARRHSGYLLLTGGFFVCGFHVAFVGTHLPAYLSDYRVSSLVGAGALSLIGAANIVGAYSFGWLGDRYRKKYLLSILYLSRAVVIGLFLTFPVSNVSALLFGRAIGLLWLATVPLTSGIIAAILHLPISDRPAVRLQPT